MIEARPWLPQNGLVCGRSVSEVGTIAAAWGAHWFDAPPLTLATRWTRVAETTQDADGWQMPLAIADGLRMRSHADAEEVVMRALVKLPGRQSPRQNEDERLLGTVAAAVIADLRERLSLLVPQRPVRIGGPDFTLAFTDLAGRPVLELLADETLLVLLTREGVVPTRDLPSLTRRDDAVGRHLVEAAALIGRARLPYADLLALAVGDVLILDTPHGTHLDLLIEGGVAAQRAVPALTSIQDLPSQ